MKRLKPCPICKSKPEVIHYYLGGKSVRCSNWKCQFGIDMQGSLEKAIEVWNKSYKERKEKEE